MANFINGRVFDERSRRPVPGLMVEAVTKRDSESLGIAQTNADGAFGLAVDRNRFKALATNGEDVGFRVTGPNREEYTVSGGLWSGREPDEVVSVVVRPPEVEPTAGDRMLSVQGVVTDAAGVAAVGLDVEVWDRSVADKNLVGTAPTGTDGRYVVTFDDAALSGKPAADLLVRVGIAGRAGTVLTESDTLFLAPRHATVDLVVERADVPAAPEYGRLLAHVKPPLGDRHLGDVDADGVGYLAGRGAWDARGVAMAARAEQFSAQTRIPASHYYAIMRDGLPGDLDQLYRLDDNAVREVLQRPVQGGVISADDDIEHTLRLYRKAALESLRNFRPEGRVSSLGDMLSVRLDADRQRIFLDTYRTTNSDPDELWSSLARRGFDKRTIGALQIDALLGELTRQNAPVVARLVERTGLGGVAELADHGFYQAAAWRDVVGDDVPEGLTVEQYTSGLATQVATRFPSRGTADLVRSDAVAVPPQATHEVAAFFAQRSGRASIGVVPCARGRASRTSALEPRRAHSRWSGCFRSVRRTTRVAARNVVTGQDRGSGRAMPGMILLIVFGRVRAANDLLARAHDQYRGAPEVRHEWMDRRAGAIGRAGCSTRDRRFETRA